MFAWNWPEASVYTGFVSRGLNKTREFLERSGFETTIRRSSRAYSILSGRSEYLQGPSRDLDLKLREIAEPEIRRVERLLGIDLDAWRETPVDEDAAMGDEQTDPYACCK